MGIILGGKIEDYPGPLKFRWPDDVKHLRELVVTITSWKGTELGATHYYVSIEQEDNPFWGEEEQNWIVCWDHWQEKKGKRINERLKSLHEAMLWVDQTVTDLFSDMEYDVRFTNYTDDDIKAKWNALRRDGD